MQFYRLNVRTVYTRTARMEFSLPVVAGVYILAKRAEGEKKRKIYEHNLFKNENKMIKNV